MYITKNIYDYTGNTCYSVCLLNGSCLPEAYTTRVISREDYNIIIVIRYPDIGIILYII